MTIAPIYEQYLRLELTVVVMNIINALNNCSSRLNFNHRYRCSATIICAWASSGFGVQGSHCCCVCLVFIFLLPKHFA